MAKNDVTRILEKYNSGIQLNSFYEPQNYSGTFSDNFADNEGEKTVYYIDASSGEFRSKNTLLLG